MDKILKGVMKYRFTDRKTMVEQFKQVANNPTVRGEENFIHDLSVVCTDLHLSETSAF